MPGFEQEPDGFMATQPAFAEKAHRFTVRRIFFGDTVLNWFLGALMTFLPGLADRVLRSGAGPLLPPGVYRVIGVIFLLFAAWQTAVLVRGRMGAPALWFAAFMADAPVVLLTAALVYLNLPLRPGWRIVLWVGDVYMFLLGLWYVYLAAAIRKGEVAPEV
jgi:hypothetical protein